LQNLASNKAVLKLPQIIALYIGAVLGSGILIIPGIAAQISGPASLLAWGLMALLVLPMALTMGLLSAKYPNVGGIAFFVTKAFNAKFGSLIGWYFTMAVMVGAPVLALTGAGYLCAALGWGDTPRLIIASGILFFGLLANYFGMKVTGQLQIAVVVTTLAVLIITIAGSCSKIEHVNFKPFMPYGWISVGSALTLLFWCFIGWEAVSSMSGEFQNPEKDAIKGTIIAAVVISLIYFLTALVIVGTHSYGPRLSDTSLIYIIRGTFGKPGAIIAGFAALFICMAPAIAYIGAIARMAYSLSENGYAPKALATVSGKYKTPLGGLCFLATGFIVVLFIFSTRIVSLATLIQIPNAAFILTYAGGCAAGIKLLKGTRVGVFFSLISLVFSISIFFFVKWTVGYPIVITLFWISFLWATRRWKVVDRGN
jgi:amino acid efflux transporter